MGILMGNSREKVSPFPLPTFPSPEGRESGKQVETGKPDGKVDGKRETSASLVEPDCDAADSRARFAEGLDADEDLLLLTPVEAAKFWGIVALFSGVLVAAIWALLANWRDVLAWVLA